MSEKADQPLRKHKKEEEQTLIGLVLKDGKLVQQIRHHSGEIELRPVEEIAQVDLFQDTETVPHDWSPTGENPITERILKTARTAQLTVQEHTDRSCRLQALLIKVFSGRVTDPAGVFDTKGNTALAEILRDLCKIAGPPWDEMSSRIR